MITVIHVGGCLIKWPHSKALLRVDIGSYRDSIVGPTTSSVLNIDPS